MTIAFKLAGVVLTVGAGGLLGLMVAESYRARERELAAWITALTSLQTEISFGHTRLGQAMRRAGLASGGTPARVLARAAELLEHGESGGVGECLAAALGARPGEQRDEIDALVVLGRRLGTSDATDQARHIGLAIRRLEGSRAKAEDVAAHNCRVWSSMGFLLGGMLTLALL
jgi:stage III sporulation protein AB